MRKIIAYLRLIRWMNLLIIILGLSCFQYFIINPSMNSIGLYPTLYTELFVVFLIATCCIAAAGNIVNDYFDFELDKQFKPERDYLGTVISMDAAVYLIGVLNFVGVAAGFWLSSKIGNFNLGYLFVFTAVLLWVYSTFLKKIFLAGNVLIAFLTSLLFIMLLIFEKNLFNGSKLLGDRYVLTFIYWQTIGYAGFAFVSTLMREIVKDAEDKEGDAHHGMKTIPIVLSAKWVNFVLFLLGVLLIAAVARVQWTLWQNNSMAKFYYCCFTVQFIMMTNLFLILFCKTTKDYKNLSTMIKLYMLFGILSIPAFHYFNH